MESKENLAEDEDNKEFDKYKAKSLEDLFNTNLFKIDLGEMDFASVLDNVFKFTFLGKGNQRHGNDKTLWDQDWKKITDSVGEGFLSGQALKKIMELKNLDSTQAKLDEIKGAISYLVFLYLYTEKGTDC